MQSRLLTEIEQFLAETGMPAWTFGFRAVKNGKLLKRLRGEDGLKPGRVWPETEAQIRAFIIDERRQRSRKEMAT